MKFELITFNFKDYIFIISLFLFNNEPLTEQIPFKVFRFFHVLMKNPIDIEIFLPLLNLISNSILEFN
jgi:hypothetical protein